jgi:hypothetical protein
MSPAFSRGSSGCLYRYYVSASLQQGAKSRVDDIIRRISADAIEKILDGLVSRWLPNSGAPLDVPLSIALRANRLIVDMPGDLAADISARLSDGETMIHASRKTCRFEVPIALPLRGGKRLITTGHRSSRPDPTLIAGLRKAHAMVSRDRGLPVVATAPESRYKRELLRLAFLAPDIQRDILAGHQPPTLTLEKLRHTDIPLCWTQQRKMLGWS